MRMKTWRARESWLIHNNIIARYINEVRRSRSWALALQCNVFETVELQIIIREGRNIQRSFNQRKLGKIMSACAIAKQGKVVENQLSKRRSFNVCVRQAAAIVNTQKLASLVHAYIYIWVDGNCIHWSPLECRRLASASSPGSVSCIACMASFRVQPVDA